MIKKIIKIISVLLIISACVTAASCKSEDAGNEIDKQIDSPEDNIMIDGLFDISGYPESTAPDPRNPDDLIIYLCSVGDYGASADGETDNTKAFQKALDYAYSMGGGSVYVPPGTYSFNGSLKIPRSVYLVGAWADPDLYPQSITAGTVLLVRSDKNNADGTPFITVGASAGLIGLTFNYPEQLSASNETLIPYPATILIKDNHAGDGTQHASSIECVTLTNSFFGIDGTKGNQLFYINTARITAFDKGFAVNKCYDCGRTMNLSVSPRYYFYWAEAAGNNPDITEISKITKEHTVGIVMMRTDWQMMYKTTVESCRVGVSCERNPESVEETAGNGSLIEFSITDCSIGIDCYYGSFQFSRGKIESTGDRAVSIRINPTVVGNFSFYDCEISSDGLCVETLKNNSGVLSIQNCDFTNWHNRAINHAGGSLEVQSSLFRGKNEAIFADASASTLVCGGNTFESTVKVQLINNLTGENSSAVDESFAPMQTVDFSTAIGTPPVIADIKNIVNVIDYGAKGNAVCGESNSDDTPAFKAAIEAAGEGGIVYVPAGYYNVAGTLEIPSGVELRGISESLHVTTGEGSVILVTSGAGDEDGTPFITLESGAGLRGLTFWYPEQNYKKIVLYPWLIRVSGQNAYIRDICVGNCYQAIDLASFDCGGHHVENITGCILKNGIAVDGSTAAGYIINTHFNLSFYTAVWGTRLSDASGSFGESDMFSALINFIGSNLTAYSFGATTDQTVLYAFNYRAFVGMRFTGGFKGRLCGSGVDGSVVGLYITGAYTAPLRMLNFADDIVPGSSKIGNVGIYIDADEGSEAALVSSSASSYNYVPPYLINLVSGKLTLQGFCANVSPIGNSAALLIQGGEAIVAGVTFRHVGPLDAKGAFKAQTEKSRAVDVRVKSGKLSLRGATAKYFFATKSADGDNVSMQYVIAK